MTCVLIRRDWHTDYIERQPYEDMEKTAIYRPFEAKERSLKKQTLATHLNLVLASTIVRKINFCYISDSVCALCYNRPINLTHSFWGKNLFANRLKQKNFLDEKLWYLTKGFSSKVNIFLLIEFVFYIKTRDIVYFNFFF